MSILHKIALSELKVLSSVKSLAVYLMLVMSVTLNGQCNAVNGSTGTDLVGTQAFTGRLGMRFTVNSPIRITRLGAFDSGQNGFNSTITVAIINAAGTVVVPSTGTPLSLVGTIGTYNGPFQMVGGFAPVTLAAGNYTVIAYGYGPSEFNGNTATGSSLATTNDGGGLITHVDSPWDNIAAMGVPGNTHVIGGFHAGNFTFSGIAPVLTTSINGVAVTSNNDGVNDTGSFAVCNGVSPNITINSFSDTTGQSNIYVQQEIINNNTNLVPWCNNCAADITLFAGATSTASLITPGMPGIVTLRFRAFVDADGSDDFTPGECAGDWIIYTVTINQPIANITPDPAEACILTDLPLNGNPSGGSGSYTTHLWSGAGAAYLNNTAIVNPIFNHNTTGMYALTYTVTDSNGCTGTDDITVNLRDVGLPVISCPTGPITMTADPDRCTAVVCFPVSAMDLCPVNLPTTLADHTYIGTFNGHTYFRSNNLFTWEAANSAAVGLGGHLVSITGQLEQTFLNNNIPNNILNQFWIGLRFSPSLNQFKWTTGEAVTYFNWGVGQPINIPPLSGDYVYHLEFGTPAIEGWYNLLDVLPRRYIVEFQGFPVTLVSGLPSGANFPVGTTAVTYRATDSGGNTDECTFDVIVQDMQNPTIVCPANITLNIQTPGVCDTTATWGPVIVADNCTPPLTLDTIRIGVNAGKARGSAFAYGVHPIEYQVSDMAGNTAICSFTITIRDFNNPSLGCKPVNFSLDGDCKGVLTPTDVLTGWEHPSGIPQLGCDTLYKIQILGSNGQVLGDTLRFEHLGKTLNYSIMHPSGLNCWNTVLIEDKIKPTLRCLNDTINCIALLTTAKKPVAFDNCMADVVQVDEKFVRLNCHDLFVGYYARVWKAVDKAGNESEATCNDTVFLRRTSLAGLVFPRDTVLSCSSAFPTDSKGFPYPNPVTSTGVPRLNGVALFPFQSTFICNGIVEYEDILVIDTKCKKMIQRVWKIQEWHCDTLAIINMPVQIIEIKDTIAPVIPALSNITVSTQSKSCKGLVQFPTLNITDNCNVVYIVNINAVSNGIPSGVITKNGGTLELEKGDHSITYSAIDECGNKSTMQYRITVLDKTDPVALCDQFATVSLKPNGYTEITATAVDDGSYDECGPVTLKIRRMEDPCGFGADTAWYDKVGFCCADGDQTRMVQLLVTDQSGNTNICMVSVRIQNKVIPTIVCPADRTVNCTFTYDINNLSAYFGAPIISGSICFAGLVPRDIITVDSLNQCGIGYLIRTITLPNNGASCSQRITFTPVAPFTVANITWPQNYTVTTQCSPVGLDPDVTGRPTFTEGVCDMIGMRHDDEVFSFTTNGACFKVIRTWTVLDWCQRNTDNTVKTWKWEQEIKVMDTIKPILNLPPSVTFETLRCGSDTIMVGATATDCTPAADLKWSWVVKRGNTTVKSGTGNTIRDSFDLGEYTVNWIVEDRCGNASDGSSFFRVITKKAPSVTCIQGLAAPVVLMDTTGDGIGDSYMAMLRPSFFDNKSTHVCNVPIRLSFSTDVNDTIRIYTCDSVGVRAVRLYATDIYGNQSYCTTFVNIQATNVECPGLSPLLAEVSGKATKEDNEEIESVTVELRGSEQNPVSTDKSGNYKFDAAAVGGNYQIVPTKNGDDMNGVSTLDIVMIQRHILGIEKLKTPYQILAADANNSNTVTAADLIELRKLVLGINQKLSNSGSWRFIDRTLKFNDVLDPWTTTFVDKYMIDKLSGNMQVDFMGIKVGDVNGNAKSKNFATSTESRNNCTLNADDRIIQKGEVLEVPIKMLLPEMVYGMQASLQTQEFLVRDVKAGKMKISKDQIFITPSKELKLSLSTPDGVQLNEGDELMILELEALTDGKLSEMLKVGTSLISEIYTSGMESKNVTLTWRDKSMSGFDILSSAPNPWNTHTVLGFDIPQDGQVTLKVTDYTGRQVLSLREQYRAGHNEIQINRADIGHAGVYVYEIRYGDKVLGGKMIVID